MCLQRQRLVLVLVQDSAAEAPGPSEHTRSSVFTRQGNVAPVTRRGRNRERRTRDGQKCWGGGALDIKHTHTHTETKCHTASSPFSPPSSPPPPHFTVSCCCCGWCSEELQECCWGFPSFCSSAMLGYTLAHGHTQMHAHFLSRTCTSCA